MIEITQEDILRYLGGPYKQDDFEHKSAYIAALTDARRITGRNEGTGEVRNREDTGSWAGALVYMSLIDHVGGLFKMRNKNSSSFAKDRDFTRALDYFSDLSKKEILALYALRCSFAHDYFLFNIRKDPLLTHCFAVCTGDSSFIALPSRKWDGSFSKTKDRETVVNLEKLGGTVENIHSTLKDLVEKDDLEVIPGKEVCMLVNYVRYQVES